MTDLTMSHHGVHGGAGCSDPWLPRGLLGGEVARLGFGGSIERVVVYVMHKGGDIAFASDACVLRSDRLRFPSAPDSTSSSSETRAKFADTVRFAPVTSYSYN